MCVFVSADGAGGWAWVLAAIWCATTAAAGNDRDTESDITPISLLETLTTGNVRCLSHVCQEGTGCNRLVFKENPRLTVVEPANCQVPANRIRDLSGYRRLGLRG